MKGGSEIASWGMGGGDGNPAAEPEVWTLFEGAENGQKTKCVSERVSMCERCVCPNLFICCTGGL